MFDKPVFHKKHYINITIILYRFHDLSILHWSKIAHILPCIWYHLGCEAFDRRKSRQIKNKTIMGNAVEYHEMQWHFYFGKS